MDDGKFEKYAYEKINAKNTHTHDVVSMSVRPLYDVATAYRH